MSTDNKAENGRGADDIEPASQPQAVKDIYAIPDGALGTLVALADHDETFELGVTLLVSGVVITGILVSGGRYFDQLADWMAEQGAAGMGDAFARTAAQVYRDAQPASDDQDATAAFIHLRNAQVFLSTSDTALPKTLWRGRLSHVSGWSIGSLCQEGHDTVGALQS